MEETDVIICGGGPTGVLLSALLSRLRVANVVLERESGITTDPRGIALDEDGIRALQAVGIYDKIFTEIGSSRCSNDRGLAAFTYFPRHVEVQLHYWSSFKSVQEADDGN